MSNNRTFFKNVREGQMTLGDIFSDVSRKHSEKETGQVFIAGTPQTTPREADMLAGWQKPFLFARFFVSFGAFLLLCYVLATLMQHPGGYAMLIVFLPFLVPITLLLLVWEMNVPRNISLYEVVKIVGIGGIISIMATQLIAMYLPETAVQWAGLLEEPAKLLVIYLVLKKKNYKYTINGVLVGMAVGTGFALIEDVHYVFNNGMAIAVGQEWGTMLGCGLLVALARTLTALSGHGVFAALYGGALVKVKGSEEVRFGHLFNGEFLAYFAASILLHALHNSGISLGLPVLFGMVPCEYLIIGVLAIILLLNSMKIGVNQVVNISASKNGGRVTMAVNRGAAPAGNPAPAQHYASGADVRLECVAGPSVGQSYRCTGSMVLGRSAGKCDVALPGCESVSGAHCRVEVSGSRVTVTDLNSTNGTYMNEQRLAPHQAMPVSDGALIYLGNKNCAFRVRIR